MLVKKWSQGYDERSFSFGKQKSEEHEFVMEENKESGSVIELSRNLNGNQQEQMVLKDECMEEETCYIHMEDIKEGVLANIPITEKEPP